MATTYINGTAVENTTGNTYLGKNSKTKLGAYDVGEPASWERTTRRQVIGDNLAQGSFSQPPKHLFNNDRAPNEPSGYNPNGSASYGNGKLNTNTTFNADYSYASSNAKFTFATPQRPSGYKFTDL